VKVLVIALALSPLTAFAQAGKAAPTTATYIMKEEIDKILSIRDCPAFVAAADGGISVRRDWLNRQ
jgi:hypothetical protein